MDADIGLLLTGFLAATVRISTPLLFAATGEMLNERAGVINLGIEGAMLAGALASAIGAAAHGPWTGVLLAVMAGVAVAGLFSLVAIGAGADQIITGTAVTLAAVGLTGTIYRTAFGPGGPGLTLPTLPAVGVPGLRAIPVLGPALFSQPVLTYMAWETLVMHTDGYRSPSGSCFAPGGDWHSGPEGNPPRPRVLPASRSRGSRCWRRSWEARWRASPERRWCWRRSAPLRKR